MFLFLNLIYFIIFFKSFIIYFFIILGGFFNCIGSWVGGLHKHVAGNHSKIHRDVPSNERAQASMVQDDFNESTEASRMDADSSTADDREQSPDLL